MPTYITQFAQVASSEQTEGIFGALGIDWQMLLLQGIGFLVLVWVMSKFIYPIFMRIVDARQAKIEEGTKAAEQAEKKAREAEEKIEATLKKARGEAAEIVSTAKTEATQMVEAAETGAKSRAERIVAEAQEEIAKDVLAARKALEKDTINLVKKAAGLAVSSIADEKLDTALVKRSVEEAKRS